MSTKSLFALKRDDCYFHKLTNDTVLLGENIYKKIMKTFKIEKNATEKKNARKYRQTRRCLEDNCISSCSESLPFYCKSEIIHCGDIFTSRNGHACVLDGSVVYIYGGLNEITPPSAGLILYNFDTHMFKRVQEKNKIKFRSFATLDIIYSSELKENCLFLFGGKNNSYTTNDTHLFVLNKGYWKLLKVSYAPPPIFGHVSFRFQNVIFIHGGNMGNSKLNADMWCYFEIENKWVKVISKDEFYEYKIHKPTDRYFHSCSLNVSNHGNDVTAYFFGGLDSSHTCVEDTFWCYSLNNGKWESLENSAGESPHKRYGHGSMIINKRWLVIYGGCNLTWYRKSILKDMYAYDINLKNWSYVSVYGMTPMIHQFYGNMVQIDESGYFYIFGGIRDNETCCNVYKYSPLFTSHSFSYLHDRIQALAEKIEYLQKHKSVILNYSFRAQLNELSIVASRISYTLSKYLQVVEDLKEKIKLSNQLALTNYEQIFKKFQKNTTVYNDLVARVEELEMTPHYTLCNISEGIKKHVGLNESIVRELSLMSTSQLDTTTNSVTSEDENEQNISVNAEEETKEARETKKTEMEKKNKKKKKKKKKLKKDEEEHTEDKIENEQAMEDSEKKKMEQKNKTKQNKNQNQNTKQSQSQKQISNQEDKGNHTESEKYKESTKKILNTNNETRIEKPHIMQIEDQTIFNSDFHRISYRESKISKMNETQKNKSSDKTDKEKKKKKDKQTEDGHDKSLIMDTSSLFKKLDVEQDDQAEQVLSEYLDE